MDDSDFRRLWDGSDGPESSTEAFKKAYLQIRTDQLKWMDWLSQYKNGTNQWDEERLVALLNSSLLGMTIAQLAIQYLYWKETGRNLDVNEAHPEGS